MDPDHYWEQEESVKLLDEHRDSLVAEAREILARMPGAKLVGLVLAPGSSEAKGLAAGMINAGQAVSPDAGAVLVVPRDFALTLLRANAPAQLDWLESDAGKLPLVCATKSGVRLGWARLDPS